MRSVRVGLRAGQRIALALPVWGAQFLWCATLLGVAGSQIAFAQIGPTTPPCSASGSTVTCTGTVTAGDLGQGLVVSGPTYETLNVTALTGAAISPSSGVSGIRFLDSSGAGITVNSDVTGIPGIFVSNAAGIRVRGSANAFVPDSGGVGVNLTSLAGSVNVTSAGAIQTSGASAEGIFGVNGALSQVYSFAVAGTGHFSSTAIGSNLEINNHGSITTTGQWSNGISAFNDSSAYSYLQYGADSATTLTLGGAVSVTNAGTIATSGISAYGVRAHATSDSRTENYGTAGTGTNSAAALSGSVSVLNQGSVTTTGEHSRGLIALSSAYAIAQNDYGADSASSVSQSGDITLTNNGLVSTEGNFAFGIAVESYASSQHFSLNTSTTPNVVATSFGGNVSISNSGTISTIGVGAHGILAVIGAGTQSSEGFIGNSTLSATSGSLTISNTGTITATGASSYGVFADNIASIYFSSSGTSSALATTGPISISSSGNITASGPDSTAIWARSSAFSGTSLTYGNIIIDIGATATITGGSGSGVGIEFLEGAANKLTNYGTIQALSGLAVRGGFGSETIDNYGTIIGNVMLGSGTNAFNNQTSGTFRSGSTVNLGAGNTWTNAGDLSPGGVGVVQVTVLTGNLVQTGTGKYTVDIDQSGAGSDVVNVSGTVSVAGLVAPNVISLSTQSGSIVIASGSSVTNTAAAVDTSTVDFSLGVVGNTLVLYWQPASILALLTGPLTPNQEATAIYLDTLNTSGPSAALQALIDAIKGQPNEAAILAALDRIHPEHYLAHLTDTLHSSMYFLNSALSCPKLVGAGVQEGQCFWAKMGGRMFDWDRTNTNIGGHESAMSVAGGIQVALQGNWRLGAAFSYEETNIRTNNSARSDGERIEGAVVLKNRWGNTSLAAAAFGGYGSFDTQRTIGLAGIGTATGKHEVSFGGVHARLSHDLRFGKGYVRPHVDLNATYLSYGDFDETGGGAANLSVRGGHAWVLSVSPAIQVGADMRFGKALLVSPYVKAGMTAFNDANFALTSSLLSAPLGTTPFTVTSKFDQVFFDASAGIDIVSLSGISAKLSYDGHFAKNSEVHSGGIKVTAPLN